MKSKNTLLLSVIIPRSQEGELTYEWAEQELQGIPHEIVVSSTWAAGMKKSTGDFICFLEKDCVLGQNYFSQLFELFDDKPSFRKLAMVAPAVGVNSYDNRIYGFRIALEDIYPAFIPSSSSAYLVQAAYVPGAILRRSAIEDFRPSEKSIVFDSVNLGLYLWSSGQRVMLDPKTLYVSTDDTLDEPFGFNRNSDTIINKSKGVSDLFKREAIG